MTGQAYRDGPADPNAPLWPGWRNMASLVLFILVFMGPLVLLWWRYS